MDTKRDPAIRRQKKIKRFFWLAAALIVLAGTSIVIARLKPAAPLVPAGVPWIESVKRGQMLLNVHGTGTLVPEDIRWLISSSAARVERLVLPAGASVTADSVILELSNADLKQSVVNAELGWKSALAQLENQRALLRGQRLTQENAVKDAESQYALAQADLDANRQLANDGLVSQITVSQKQSTLETTFNKFELAKEQLQIALENEPSQLAPQQASVNQQKMTFDNFQRQFYDLQVKAGMTGVLQVVAVERGQQVAPGTNLARVADPSTLKAVVRISETQTRDLSPSQRAEIDTRNGPPLKGHVVRIDPAPSAGTLGVHVSLDDRLHPGDRPDQSVDGTIELTRLSNVIKMSRPAFGQENSSVTLFKLTPNGNEALRTTVKLGRASVTEIEIVEGLQPGDQIILSDMSQYDAYDRVRIK
jgi:HlyD family secretion protein